MANPRRSFHVFHPHAAGGARPRHLALEPGRIASPAVRTSSPSLRRREPRGGGVLLGRLFGVQVRLDWSLLIIFALILFNLGAGVFPLWHPRWSPLVTWSTAFAAAVLFFASVLVHELSHALVARSKDIPVNRITLFVFGGMAHMEGEPGSPGAEFWMAVVGPVTSIVIGIAATLAGVALAGHGTQWFGVVTESPAAGRAALSGIGPVTTLLLWLGPINLLLGVFNIIPGFPLDGGRVLRSILWHTSGDRLRATRWASAAGRAFAWLLMVFGVMYFFAGALAQGLWLLLIGWFLNNAARMSYEQLLVRHALADVPVTRVMRARLQHVASDLSLESFVRDHLMASDQDAFPVDSDGHLVGLVESRDVRKVPQAQWADTSVARVMTPSEGLATLPVDAPADEALQELARRDGGEIPIVDGREIVGLVRRRDLLRWLALQQGTPAVRTSHG